MRCGGCEIVSFTYQGHILTLPECLLLNFKLGPQGENAQKKGTYLFLGE